MSKFCKLPECDRCLNYHANDYLRCAVHLSGFEGEHCPDFREDSQAEQRQAQFLKLDWVAEEEWQPERASYYSGKLIINPVQQFTRQQQLELLDHHPMFTGRCPECEQTIAVTDPPQSHWDCCFCSWQSEP